MPIKGDIDQNYPKILEQENKICLLEPFKGAKLHHRMQCLVCCHIWTATPISKRQTFKKYAVGGCPMCNQTTRDQKYETHRQDVIQRLHERGVEIIDQFYDGRLRLNYTGRLKDEKITVRNVLCGHQFKVTPLNLIQSNITCSVCGIQDRIAPLTAWSKSNSAKWQETASEWAKYKSKVAADTEQTYQIYKKQINPLNLPRGKAGVQGAYHLDHIVPKRFCFDNDIPPEVCSHYTNLQMIGWRENVGSRNHIKGTIPPLFFQYISTNSKLEQYAKQLAEILPGCQKFVNIADIIVTVYDPKTTHAIVVLPIDRTYANQKSALATHKALTAAHIPFTILFEDELANQQLLAAKLKHYIQTGTADRIHARQCEIRQCDKSAKKQLLDTNHIQGNDNAPIAYGAYYNQKLVAVMTFTHPRVALGQRGDKDKTGVWELSRFCTDTNYRIPGIASKLLTHFKRNHEWKQIYSYADKRWSTGNLYHALGFDLVADTPPDYFYIVNGQRKHRWNYRKDALKSRLANYDPTATEYQNMVDHGYWRIWDCGTLKFSITNKG